MRTNDPLQQFLSVRKSLFAEKSRLESRLQEIDQVLSSAGRAFTAPGRSGRKPRLGFTRRTAPSLRSRGGISLKAAALQVMKSGPKTKQEILDGAKKLGWTTTSKNPMNLLNPLLYGKNPKFKNAGGKFSWRNL